MVFFLIFHLQTVQKNGTITPTPTVCSRAGPEWGKSISTEKRSITMAHLVTDECVACGACVDTCPVGAISLEDKAVVDAASCVDCGACEGVCPTGAIKAE